MLLRNPSSSILKSWTSVLAERSSISRSFSCCYSPESTRLWKQSEVKMTSPLSPDRRMPSSYSGFDVPIHSTSSSAEILPVDNCVGDGGYGGKISGGGGSGGSSGSSDSNKNMDAYYQKMIELDPSNPLVLGNYVKFLKEVQHNLAKAEEYCERAILLNPGDGDVLSMYADLIWKRSKDAERAEAYFDRAVQASPLDCSVAASYARFLWEVEEPDDSEECHNGMEGKTGFSLISSAS